MKTKNIILNFSFVIIGVLVLLSSSCKKDESDNAPEKKIIVNINSDPPGAEIFINNGSTGKFSPAIFENLTEGTYDIVLKKANYRNYEESLFLQYGDNKTIDPTLILGGWNTISYDEILFWNETTTKIALDGIEYTIPNEGIAKIDIDYHFTAYNYITGNEYFIVKIGNKQIVKVNYQNDVEEKITVIIDKTLIPSGTTGQISIYGYCGSSTTNRWSIIYINSIKLYVE